MTKINEKIDFFIGPCVIESKDFTLEVAHSIKEMLRPMNEKIQLTFKASFDKANRSSKDSFRGPGLEKGLKILQTVKEETGLPVLTDFHLPEQAEAVAEVVDTLQIPAFLCRQSDMIFSGAEAAKKYSRRLKIKKGQFLAPQECQNIVTKACEYLPHSSILLTERGTSFGYQNLVVDMDSFRIMKSFGVKTIHDATHCVQRPGGLGDKTGGKREAIKTLAFAALAAGADGVFMEVHPEPEKALSDASTVLPLNSLFQFVEELVQIKEFFNEVNSRQ